MNPVQNAIVTRAEAGQKLLQFLLRRLEGSIPQAAVMRWIRTGQVRVDSGRVKPFIRLTEGQIVRIPPYAATEKSALKPLNVAMAPDILFENESLLVLNKPAGLAVHGGTKQSASVHTWLQVRYVEAPWFPTPIHRIDRDTTGLLLVAKEYSELIHLQTLWKKGGVRKIYLAWVLGHWPKEPWERIESRMEKRGRPNRERMETGAGKIAVSWIRGVLMNPKSSLVAVALGTGRTHQIRTQLASLGHPILGDGKYGRPTQGVTLLLHAWSMTWEHQSFLCPPPWIEPFHISEDLSPGNINQGLPLFGLPAEKT